MIGRIEADIVGCGNIGWGVECEGFTLNVVSAPNLGL